MDCTKRTSKKYLHYTIILITACAIISHFFKNHTQLTLQKRVPLPAEVSTRIITPIKTSQTKKQTVTKTLRFKSTVIHHSLLRAEESEGLPPHLRDELNHMIASDDITGAIRPGDRLEVLYHEYFVNDKRNHPGNVVAAEIVNGKKHYKIVRFTNPDHKTGFYLPDGMSAKPAFLRDPLHYVRIGSYFSYHRYDPIAHRVQPHLGVDFDAPMGTPVKAISNGYVVFRKQIHGYGNTVMIQYSKAYKSFYAHLEKFARNLRPHEYVKKGQIIGYVGMTGWSTGPHLHYAVYKNGVAVNPLTVKFPHGSPVPGEFRHDFFDKSDHWFHDMRLFEKAKMASK